MAAKIKPVTLSDIAAEVKLWQNRGLGAGWMIEVVEDPDPDDSAAWVTWSTGYHWGRMSVNLKDAAFAHPVLWRHVVIHELCHLVTSPAIDFLTSNLNKDGAFYSELKRHFETVVDSFANIIQENVNVDQIPVD